MAGRAAIAGRCPGPRTAAGCSTPPTRRGSPPAVPARSMRSPPPRAPTRVLARGVDPAWSRDTKFLSFVTRKGGRTTLFLQRHGTRRVVLSRPNFGFVHAWSPTGHLLAFAATNRYGQGRVFVFDPGRAKPLRAVTRWVYGPVASIVWSRDGKRILFARTAG